MQVTYDGAHSLLIGHFINNTYDRDGFVDTWEDLHLIPVSRPVINPPPIRDEYLDIPGANGSVDLTEALIGRPLYQNRTGSLDFYVDNTNPEYDNWDYAYDYLANTLHGLQTKVILTDAPSFYYEGRLSVNQWKTDKMASTITIDYNLQPYKKLIWSTTEEWLWNPFDFVRGVIPDRSTFVHTVPGDTFYPGNYTSWGTLIELTQDVTGTIPVMPIVTARTLDTQNEGISWEQTSLNPYRYPSVGVTHYNPDTGSWSNMIWTNFQESDGIADQDGKIRTFKMQRNSFIVGSNKPGYKCQYVINNRFMSPIIEGYQEAYSMKWEIDFRPGRL